MAEENAGRLQVEATFLHSDLFAEVQGQYDMILSNPPYIEKAVVETLEEIPTIDSKVKVKIEPGTQPGKVLRLRGKGLPNVNSLVTVTVQVIY